MVNYVNKDKKNSRNGIILLPINLISLHTNKTKLAEEKHNRRNFIKLAGAGLLLGTAFLWDKMVRSEKELTSLKTLIIPFDANREFTFHDKFIVVNKDKKLQVFSSHCTHLGCTIHHAENGQLLCPCHGSTFNLEGKPTKGPAIKSLEKLAFSIDEKNQSITVEL